MGTKYVLYTNACNIFVINPLCGPLQFGHVSWSLELLDIPIRIVRDVNGLYMKPTIDPKQSYFYIRICFRILFVDINLNWFKFEYSKLDEKPLKQV